jgi:membrane protein YdbS with pleckstrin-like domain
MRYYYWIWVDCIIRLRSIETNKDNWQIKSQIAMSIAMTFNFLLIMAILQRNILEMYFYKINIPILSSLANNALTILILFFLPCVVINYLLIFRAKRYERLIDRYPYRKGRFFITYFLISLFLPIILLWSGIILTKLDII